MNRAKLGNSDSAKEDYIAGKNVQVNAKQLMNVTEQQNEGLEIHIRTHSLTLKGIMQRDEAKHGNTRSSIIQ